MSYLIQNTLLTATLILASSAASAAGFPGTGPVRDADFYDDGAPLPAKVELGKILYFDKILSGNKKALSTQARIGMNIYYGKGGCSNCHSGAFQTDQDFHAVAMPQIGPGKGDNLEGYYDGHDDFGREMVTGDDHDRFHFRTPTLRNIALSPPYGHAGAYNSLEAVIRHKMDSVNSLHDYDQEQAFLPYRSDLDAIDFVVMDDNHRRNAIADSNELDPVRLKEKDIQALIAFLHALTDPAALDMRGDVPDSVPSGLPVWD
jgi:cytochrome c peroxidase